MSYKRFLLRRRRWYKTIGKTYCSLLQGDVFFTSQGFYHLRYDAAGRPRARSEWRRRLTILEFAPTIVQYAKTIQEYRKTTDFEYWALRKEIGKQKRGITVIVRRKRKNGQLFFRSIMEK